MRASVLLFAMGASAAVQANSSVAVTGGCGIVRQIGDGQIQNPVEPVPCSYSAPPAPPASTSSSSAVPSVAPSTSSAPSSSAVTSYVSPPISTKIQSVVVPSPPSQQYGNSTIVTSVQKTITKSGSSPTQTPASTPSSTRSTPAQQTTNAAANVVVSGASMGLLAALAVLLG